MTLVATAVLGVLIGVSLGALGGGGSILTVPALVYAVGEQAKAATTDSLVIVGITSLVGSIGHARAGRVHWRAGAVFGIIGVAASFAGTVVNRRINPDALLLAFAGLMLIAAVALFARTRNGAAAPTVDRSTSPPVSGVGTAAKVVGAGLVVGFLTGLLGVGGGFIVVPALVLALRYAMPVAVGTSLVVISINSAGALLARAGHEQFHWVVIVPFTVAAIVGTLVGKRIADRVAGTTLTRAFAALLVAVAAYVAIRAGSALR